MSRALAAHANLEHLRKQAKGLLRELQRRNPGSKLADAQHAVARGYGFASWPKLKVHVESLARLAGPAATLVAEPSQGSDARSAEVPVKENLFVGNWTANVSKSKRHPLNEFQSATLEFVVTGDTVTITDVVVNDSGQEDRGQNTIQADGKEHPAGRPGYAVKARWHGSHVLESVVKKDGEVEGRVTYEVSANGNTLTVSTKHASGDQMIVFDRT